LKIASLHVAKVALVNHSLPSRFSDRFDALTE